METFAAARSSGWLMGEQSGVVGSGGGGVRVEEGREEGRRRAHGQGGANATLLELGQQHTDVEAALPQARDVHPERILPGGRPRLRALVQRHHGRAHRRV